MVSFATPQLLLVATCLVLSSKCVQSLKPTISLERASGKIFSRKDFLGESMFNAIAVGAGISSIETIFPVKVNAAMENKQNVFKAGQPLGVDAAKDRFKEGQKSLNELLSNFETIQQGGGDNVRRYLGTVGTTSGLYGIKKVLRELQSEADDFVEYTENMDEFDKALNAAEGAAYMAIFVETSSSSTPPQKYLDDAKTESKRMKVYMDELAKQLGI